MGGTSATLRANIMLDKPSSLASLEERERRRMLLEASAHMAPLLGYLESLRTRHKREDVPAFDPLDGGANAEVIFLFESPGPQAVRTGFISRNNPDPSAQNMFRMLRKAGLPRNRTLLWNVVPWNLKGRKPNRRDITAALRSLDKLLALLPSLKYVVLAGDKARMAHVWLSTRTRARILACHHPSGQSLNPDRRRRFENISLFRSIARDIIGSGAS